MAEALVEFPGALLLVSHDRHLIETTCDELWSIRHGELNPFNQPLSEWQPEPVIKADSTENANSQKAQRKARAASRAQLAPLTRALKKSEQALEQAQEALDQLDSTLADPDYFSQTDPTQQARDAKTRAQLVEQLEEREIEWMEAAEALEAAQG